MNKVVIPKVQKKEIIDIFSQEINKELLLESDLFYLVVSDSPYLNISIKTSKEGIKSKIFGIFYSNSSEPKKTKIEVNLNHNNSEAEVYLLSIIKNNHSISIDGSINILNGTKKASGYLLEENLVFGENISIKTKPILNIYSNDVKASHGARIQKLDTDKMFYLNAKGISGESAERLILEGYLDYIFDQFSSIDREKIKQKII